MRQHNQRLYRLALSLVGNPDDAEDVLQDSYFRAFEKRASFAGRSGLGAWLASIVRNQAIDCLRARRSRRSAFTLEADLPLRRRGVAVAHRKRADAGPRSGIRNSASSARKPASPSRARSCPCHCPSAPCSCCGKSRACPSQQTATYLDIPVATVKTRAHRARLLLRAELGAAFPGEPHRSFEFLRERCDRIVSKVLERLALL